MQNEDAVLASNTMDSDDTLADLDPHSTALESPRDRQSSSYLMVGSNSSRSSSETRTSRFNGMPVIGSPMLAARECLSRSVSEGSRDVSLNEYLNMPSMSPPKQPRLHASADDSPSTSNHKDKHKKETTREIFDRRMKRIGASFFRRNPSHNVPRFVPNELSLGDRVGEGEFGSVFKIDSLERQPPPPLDFNVILDNTEARRCTSDESTRSAPRAPANSTMTLPLPKDSVFGCGNLDIFLKRRVAAFEDLPVVLLPSTTGKESNAENNAFNNIRDDSNGHKTIVNQEPADNSLTRDEHSNPHPRRQALKVSDQKGQMINRQNHVGDFDSFDGYVVKVVRDDIQTERKKRVAAADMAAEAKLLSALSHQNIIKVRGIMGYIERPGNYGIIMDKLRSTLQDQILEWAKVTSEDKIPTAAPEKHALLENKPHWMLLKQKKEKKKNLFSLTKFFVERMEAVSDVSQGLKYLHKKRIIFRDLKPENVGLTNENYVLFDFGLSRELKESDKLSVGKDQYHATGLTGSRLFMAPEVATNKPYGFSADVYSFGILFWEVVSLKQVFPTMTMSKHYKLVILKGRRPPSLEDILPPELNEMMESSWDKNPSSRPTFESICDILTHELEKHINENGGGNNEDKNSKSHRMPTKHLHLHQLEHALEKVTEKILKKSPVELHKDNTDS